MPRLRSIAVTLFLTLTLTALGGVLILAVLFRLSLGAGFSDYVAHLELTRLDHFEQVLIARYQQAGGWHFVREPQDLLPNGPPDNPPPRAEGPQHPPPPVRRADRLELGPRLALFDAQQRLIMGPPEASQRPKRPIQLNGRLIGYLALAALPDRGDGLSDQFLQSQTHNLILSAGVVILLSAIAAALLARHFRQPIAALAKGARQLAAGQLSARVALDRQDELGELASDFNQMAQKLERFEQSRRQWMADTSHELRTPLTILRAHTEAMRDGVMPLDHKGLGRLESAVGDLDRLVADLYQLARADVGMHDYQLEAVPLSTLFNELAGRFAEPMRQAQLNLQITTAPNAAVLGDPARLNQLFSNLLGNALRYTDAGGSVRLSASLNGPVAEITLDDSAPGVPESALVHLFERFFRVDASRSRQGGGSGLGLAICQAIVSGHGGSIRAQHSPLGGLRIALSLPLAKGRPV